MQPHSNNAKRLLLWPKVFGAAKPKNEREDIGKQQESHGKADALAIGKRGLDLQQDRIKKQDEAAYERKKANEEVALSSG